jgi:hypothetical protein
MAFYNKPVFVPSKSFQPSLMFAEPTRVKHFSGAPLYCRPLALAANIRINLKGLPVTNALAYYENPQITVVKSFIGLARGQDMFTILSKQIKIGKSLTKWGRTDLFRLPGLEKKLFP